MVLAAYPPTLFLETSFFLSFYLDSSDKSSPPQVVQASAAVALHWTLEGPEGSGQRTRHLAYGTYVLLGYDQKMVRSKNGFV